MILEDCIDRALGLACLEQWLCMMLASQGRNGFNLPNFEFSPEEINSISRCAWCNFLCVCILSLRRFCVTARMITPPRM